MMKKLFVKLAMHMLANGEKRILKNLERQIGGIGYARQRSNYWIKRIINMATQQEIVKDIRESFGSILNATQAGIYCGIKSKEARKQFLAAVPCIRTGKEIKYHAIDIAKHLVSLQRYEVYG